jgi:hypothetical protein
MRLRNDISRTGLALLCAALVWTSGCFTRRTPAPSIGKTVTLRPPIVPAPAGGELLAPPDIPLEASEPPELATTRSVPPRPRVAQPPAGDAGKTGKEPEPRIVPELSSVEMDAAKAETEQNLDTMKKNLTAASGRILNASQQDLMSKVRGFAESAREAMRSGDWMRAKNLSKKAEVLSEELVDSL